jgi:hypothetical protein
MQGIAIVPVLVKISLMIASFEGKGDLVTLARMEPVFTARKFGKDAVEIPQSVAIDLVKWNVTGNGVSLVIKGIGGSLNIVLTVGQTGDKEKAQAPVMKQMASVHIDDFNKMNPSNIGG